MIYKVIRLFVFILNLNSIATKGDDSFRSTSDESNVDLSSIQSPSTTLLLFKCPEQFGYYPDTTNCTKYFVCVFGEPLHESCTGGLYFSPELQTCDWPINVRCATHDKRLNSQTLDDNLSSFQSFGSLEDTRRLEYQTNDNKFNDENKQYFDDNFSFKTESEILNSNQFLRRKPINNLKNQINATVRTTTESPDFDLELTIEKQTTDDLNDSKIDDNFDTNKLMKEDLQNPDFEEAIASYIDENGGIHLQDGPGGLFGVVPPQTVSDHHIEVFSRPAIQDNREKLVKEKSNPMVKKIEKYDDYQRSRGPKQVQFDDDFESELMSEKIRKDMISKEQNKKSDLEIKQVVNEKQNSFKLSFDSKRNANQTLNNTINESKHKSIGNEKPNSVIIENKVNKFNVNNHNNHNNHNINISGNNHMYGKTSAEHLMSRLPRINQQRLQQQKYFKINAQKIADFNPLVKYFKTIDSALHLEPIPAFFLNYSQKSFDSNGRHPVPVAKTVPIVVPTTTTTTSVFYSYRHNTDPFKKLPTTPVPINVTQYRKTVSMTPTVTTFQRQTTIDKQTANQRPSMDTSSPLRSLVTSDSVPTRPLPLFSTPDPFLVANKCVEKSCRLPDCYCGGTDTPVGLTPKQMPQIIMITFDDAVNDVNWHIYEEIFTADRKNPNGCPIRATYYVSHEWTDYGQVQTLYSRGHEIASHSITHSFGEKFSKTQWIKEINGQREILNTYAGVKLEDIRGMRAPFLQIGGNKQFEMLFETNFTYDSSMAIFENSPPFWPYTLDYAINHECMIAPCPTKSFPGLWEIGLVMWKDLNGGRCSMGDACSNPNDENGVFDMIMKNFNRHYLSNRAPFGLFYHSGWFNTRHHLQGFLKFIDEVLKLNDVYFVTNWQLIQWMREPTPLSRIHKFNAWKCQMKDENRPNACHNPTVCNVSFKKGSRFFKTCQPCPEAYPWIGNTGLKKKNIL